MNRSRAARSWGKRWACVMFSSFLPPPPNSTKLTATAILLVFKLPLTTLLTSYRIQNCFSTISTKILENRYYFRDLWRILECTSLWITHIFAIYSDLSFVFQLSWLLVPFLTIYFGDFLCDLFVELPNFSQILVTSTWIIFFFRQYCCPIWLSF